MKIEIKKTYEIVTSKSITDIKNMIELRSERQNKNKPLFATEPVNYKKFKIIDDIIEIERNPVIGNPFGGFGNITFELEPTLKGTRITCIIDPSMINTLVGFGFAIAFPLIISFFSILLIIKKIQINTIIFLLFSWIVVVLGIAFLLFIFNRLNLESYSKTILYDLGLITIDK